MKVKEMSKINLWALLCVSLTFLALATFSILNPFVVNAQTVKPVGKQIEKAILTEDWEKVVNLLNSVDTQTPSPVLRLIKGHATLALNRNNESLCLFLSAASESDLKEWDKWTQEFVKQKPKSAIAHYFRGDALARLKEWDQALIAFTKALKINQKNALSLNARGVVYAKKGELGLAGIDFDTAISINSNLADAYANSGARNIQMKEGADVALKMFTKAIDISPNFALALHGRGNINVILFEINKAERDFEAAKRYGMCAHDLFRENFLNLTAYVHGVEKEDVLAMVPEEEIGMSLEKAFNTPLSSPGLERLKRDLNIFKVFGGKPVVGQWSFNRIGEGYYHLSKSEREIADVKINNFLRDNPGLAKHFYSGARDFAHNPFRKHEYDVGANVPLGRLEVGVGMKIPSSTTDEEYSRIGKNFQDMASKHFNLTQGVDADVADRIDDGRWPFIEYYGLLYGISPEWH